MVNDNRKEAAIKGLHAYREQLIAEIEAKKADLGSLERSIQLLSGETSRPEQLVGIPSAPESPVGAGSRYAGLKNQAATRVFLEEQSHRWYKASEVVKELRRRGVPTGKHFAAAVTGALNRLAVKGVAKKEKKAGVYKYKIAIGG